MTAATAFTRRADMRLSIEEARAVAACDALAGGGP
jgi:hypothetical protein